MPVLRSSRSNARRPARPTNPPRRARVAPDLGAVIKLDQFARIADVDRTTVAEETAQALLAIVEEHKDVEGTGQESAAKGDPRVTERRRVLSTLIADKSGAFAKKSVLEGLGDNVKADIKWLIDAERREYTVDGSEQFGWAQSDMSGANKIENHFKDRIKKQQAIADGIKGGQTKFFKAEEGSVVGISFLETHDQRSDALVDALLQFRANTSTASSSKRVDLVGPALLAEQRVLLSSANISDLSGIEARRELGLLRAVIGSHPNNSVNGIFEARNAIAAIFLDGGKASDVYSSRRFSNADFKTSWILREKPPGSDVSPYSAIHHNFSTSTPKTIRSMVTNWLFPVGEENQRPEAFMAAVDALELAEEDPAGAKALLADIDGGIGESLGDLKKAVEGTPDDRVQAKILEYMQSVSTKDLGDEPILNLGMSAAVYRSVCEDRPSRAGLAEELFKAGDAWPEMADVLYAIDQKDDLLLLRELGEARIALRNSVAAAKTGFERHELMLLDAELDRMVIEELGSAVTRVDNLETDEQKTEALWAMSAALRSAVASGLDVIRDDDDSTQANRKSLDELREEVNGILEGGNITEGEYRALMAEIRLAVTGTVQDIRSYVDARAADVATGGVDLDPEFLDQFVKQSALHYATAIADKGMTVGLKEEISADRIANVEGMRVLNSIGRVVFSKVVAAENTKELAELKPEKDALSIVYQLSEKKMVAVGGLIVDTEHAPGGNSHLNMYAMNNGIAVLAMPELRAKYGEFFANAAKPEAEGGGGIYMDEENGEFQMLTVARAKAEGLLAPDEVESLRPGLNRSIEYLKSNAAGDGFDIIAEHDAIISDERRTREVQLYVPMDEVKGIGKRCVSFDEVAKLGVHGRHLAGEKGLVLALLRSNPKLRDYVPDGSIVTTGRVRELLKETPLGGGTLNDLWNSIWQDDPKVGPVDDANILDSAFYSDKDYRADKRNELQHETKAALTEHLINDDGNGNKSLTDAGQKLYDELTANPTLANGKRWITRSSFTGEDRPGKSGAGQYESFPNLEDPVSRIEGVIGVIESTWMPEPIENNIADEVDLRFIMPSVTVQDCLDPSVSGVMISRDIQHGTRNQVSYQLVKGFGGGVEGGKTEEGVIRSSGHQVLVKYPGADEGLVDREALQKLREIVLEVETFFHDVVEPGKGYAVDMEVAREDDKWNVVQARVILMDR